MTEPVSLESAIDVAESRGLSVFIREREPGWVSVRVWMATGATLGLGGSPEAVAEMLLELAQRLGSEGPLV